MKGIITIGALMMLLLSACDEDEPSQFTSDTLQQEWQYISFTGIEGPECYYDRGDKIFTFTASTLIIENNYFDDDWCIKTFKEEGTYDYEVKVIDDTEYLFVEDTEKGRIRFIDGDLFIESWFNSSGIQLADAPTYRLEI